MNKKAKILVIDDSSRDLLLLELILTPHGYDVILSTDGEEATIGNQQQLKIA